jgi:hypothetical protein
MYIYVCFDVEDLVHPDSDDIVRDVAEMLADDGIVASMCVVGEKARLWERRGRTDVIAAVRQHDVGLHTDHHSVHPNVAEYLAGKGWIDGVAEAVRQEGRGARDLARIFGTYPSTWGTGGSSWGPQIPSATQQMGIPSNIYSYARSGGSGACWFAGQLCFHDFVEFPGSEDAYCDDGDFEIALPILLQQVEDFQRRGYSCLGLFAAHPTRLRYTVFWDALNYVDAEQTDPREYRFAPRRDDGGYRTGLRNLRRTILAVRDLPGVEIISTRALNNRFAPQTTPIAWTDLRRLARTTADGDSIVTENPLVSPAQTLDVLARAVLRRAESSSAISHMLLRQVLGPVEQPPILEEPMTVSVEVGMATCRELLRYIDETRHLPQALTVEGTPVGPAPLLGAIAFAFLQLDEGRPLDWITLQPGAEEPAIADELAEQIYREFLNWPPHPPDLRLDGLALHTRLQCWSLKPAVLVS